MCKPRKRRHASLTIRGAGSQPAPLVLYGCAPCRARSLIRALIALFVPTIGNLKPSSPLALDNDIAVPRAQFDLSNVSAGGVNLLGDQRRALPGSGRFAFRDVAASMDAESRWCGIEIGLQQISVLTGSSQRSVHRACSRLVHQTYAHSAVHHGPTRTCCCCDRCDFRAVCWPH